jgi:hypothetical protein
MVKYRVLTTYELEQLEPHFIKFLAFYGIPSDRWEEMKKNQDDGVLDMIDIFSNFVYDTTIENITYMKIATPKDIREVLCEEKSVKVYGLEVDDDSPINLTDPKYLEKIFDGELTEGISIYSAEAPYKGTRGYYIFELLEIGFRASDGKLFELLKQLKTT